MQNIFIFGHHFKNYTMNKKLLTLLLILTMMAQLALAQSRVISGKVLDQDQIPLPGVSVIIEGTTTGTVSNVDGTFELLGIKPGDKLKFSFIGMLSQTIDVGDRNSLEVTLKPDIVGLEEVIVTGYGSQKKVDVTGSVSTVKTEELKTVPTPTIAQSIMGRTTGVYVKARNAQPGEYNGISYNIRGFGDALLIIDGMPASNKEFLLLDPNDIDELNILKDAATAAVYGARAGNGVILVKTKRGKAQDAQFSYNGNYGVQQLTMLPHAVMTTTEHHFLPISTAIL